jgi:hypothetical protein
LTVSWGREADLRDVALVAESVALVAVLISAVAMMDELLMY